MKENNTNTFDAKHIEALKEIKRQEEINANSAKIDNLVNYVMSKYEEKINKAIEKDYNTSFIKIVIPSKYRIFDPTAFKKAETELRNKFNPLGLGIALNNDVCDCFLKFLCCTTSYFVTIRF